MLMVWVLFLPILTQKAIVEERMQKTWDALLTTGMSPGLILCGKFLSCLVQFAFLAWAVCSFSYCAFCVYLRRLQCRL